MDGIGLTIVISGVLVTVIIVLGRIKYRLTLSDIGDISTIYGVLVGVIVLFQVSPRLVEVKPAAHLVLHDIDAVERIGGGQVRSDFYEKMNMPLAYCSARVSKAGNAMAYNLSLEIQSEKNLNQNAPYELFVVYVFDETIKSIPLFSFDWASNSGSEHMEKLGELYRLRLPTIRSNTTLGFVIGFRSFSPCKEVLEVMRKIVTDGLRLRVLSISDGEVVKEETLLSRDVRFHPPLFGIHDTF